MLASPWITKSGIAHLVKDILELELRQGTALDVFHGAQILGHPFTVFLSHRLHLLLGELFSYLWIIPQIGLRANDEAWYSRAMMVNFGEPLFPDVFKRCWRRNRETDEEDICLWV